MTYRLLLLLLLLSLLLLLLRHAKKLLLLSMPRQRPHVKAVLPLVLAQRQELKQD